MIYSRVLALCWVCMIALCGCGNANKNEVDVTLSLWGITAQGESQDEVIRNLIEQTDEFDYYDEERIRIKRLMFCGVSFGLTLKSELMNGVTTVTKITLITSHQSKTDFEAIKSGISKRLGNPDIEDCEDETEIDGRFYGRCTWYKDKCEATLRHLHSEGGGLVVFLTPKI